MKKMLLILSLLLITNIFSQTKLVNIKVGHTYTISIPNTMMRTYDFGDSKILQYKNDLKNLYLIVVDELKEELKSNEIVCNNVEDYYEIITNDFSNEYKNYQEIKKEKIAVNGYSILTTEYKYTATDSTSETELYFFQDYVETEKYFYKVVFWTTSENADKCREYAKEISKTLKED